MFIIELVMNNPRLYGNGPFSIILIHGGPGASGSMAPLANELSHTFNVLESLQTFKTIDGQIQELHDILIQYANVPVILVGHSWGAWLSYIFAARYASIVSKVILIASGPFEDKYTSEISRIRLSRLSHEEVVKVNIIEEKLNNQNAINKKELFKQYGRLMSKADSYDAIKEEDDVTDYQPDIFFSVWKEAENLRRSGELLKMGHQISCPVAAIHGDYDPHPYDGIKLPLSKVIKNFRYRLIEKCGHTPWYERHAREKFYEILKEELELST